MVYDSKELKQMANVVRADALRAIASAGSGHVGIAMGAADILTILYANFLHSADNFILSAGHGGALLYSVLGRAGYPIGQLNTFRRMGGLPGHPEYGMPGVAATTGPLGAGVGNAVGYALVHKIRHDAGRVYCLCSDGDLMEGVAQESIAFAGRYKLNNLILLWDDNGVSIDGTAQSAVDIPALVRAAGWYIITANGNDFASLNRAINTAIDCDGPVFICCKTVLGLGTSVAGTSRAHGFAIEQSEALNLANALENPGGIVLWQKIAERRTKHDKTKIPSIDVSRVKMPRVASNMSTRELSGIYINEMLKSGVDLVGGSADLGTSTGAMVDASRHIMPGRFVGNYIDYGVREHAMGAIMNGMCAAGLRVYGSTFLVFSDYMRPAIRLAALSGIPSIFVFSHDSIVVGSDGPTHQPVEQLASLRMIPNLNVFRPCNGDEMAYVWQRALADNTRPSCIILSRQKFNNPQSPRNIDMSRGAYIIRPAGTLRVRGTILASGADVALAISVAEQLSGFQVVSVPSVGDLRVAPMSYKYQMLRGRVFAIEASNTAPWFEFADFVFGIDAFGTTGPGDVVYGKYGFDADKIVSQINKIMK